MSPTRMMQPRFLSVWEAQTVSDYRNQIIRFSRCLGFDTVSAFCAIDHSLADTEVFEVENTPEAYRQSFFDSSLAKRCPIMQHCKQSSIPIVWDQSTYLEAGQIDLWEEQARFGYKAGIGLALHLPGDHHYVIGVERDKPLTQRTSELNRLLAHLQLFAVYAHEAGFRLSRPSQLEPSGHPYLTARELEALRRTMDGLTSWEVGKALNISERTAVFHLTNAVQKLGCKTKHQAVLKALRLRLLK